MKSPLLPLLPLLLVVLLLLVVELDEELVVPPLELVVLLEELDPLLQTESLSEISHVVLFDVHVPLTHAAASHEPLPLHEQHDGSQSAYVRHDAPSFFVPWSRDGDDGQCPFTASICDWVLPVLPPDVVPEEQPQSEKQITREKRPKA